MTFVGKILVLVIVVFSLVFMGFAVTVYSAHTNWKQVADERQTTIGTRDSEVKALRDRETSLKQQLTATEQRIEQEKQALLGDFDKKQRELESLRQQVNSETERAEMNSRQAEAALQEAQDRREEAVRLRTQIENLMTEKEDLFNKNVGLQTDLFQTTSERDRAERRNQELQTRVQQLETLAANNGLDTEHLGDQKMLAVLPDVEGLVLRTAGAESGPDRYVEISIGSDDGLVQGHQLMVWRPGVSPKYLGKITVVETDPDRAVARVNSNYRIQKDDNVTSQFK